MGTLPGFGHSIARRSLDEVPSFSDTIQQPFHPMIVRSDDLELVHQSLRTLEPPNTPKFPRVNAQDSKLGPIQPWDVEDFLRPDRGRRRTWRLSLRCTKFRRGRRYCGHRPAPGPRSPPRLMTRLRHRLCTAAMVLMP